LEKMKTKSILFIILAGLYLQLSAQNSNKLITELKTLATRFKTPDSFYGPSILWGWDGLMTREVIIRDLDRFKSLNIRSLNIEAGYDLPYPYLSEGYFDLIRFGVEQAKQRGMVIWMIDECKYPSGFEIGRAHV
jgi:hypothetical protein